MAVCQYFLQGRCSFGDRCRNEHPQNRPSGFGQSSSQMLLQGKGGGSGGGTQSNNRFSAFGASSGGFKASSGGFPQSSTFSSLSSGNKPTGFNSTGSGAFKQTSAFNSFSSGTQGGGGFNSTGEGGFKQTSAFNTGLSGGNGQGFSSNNNAFKPSSGFSAFASNNNIRSGENGGFNASSGFSSFSTAGKGGEIGGLGSEPPKSAFAATPGGEGFASGSKSKQSKGGPLQGEAIKAEIKSRPTWQLSTYGAIDGKPSLLTGKDVSPEEMHLDYVLAKQSLALPAFEAKYDKLIQEMDLGLQDISDNAESYAQKWQSLYGIPGQKEQLQQQVPAFAQTSTASKPFSQPQPELLGISALQAGSDSPLSSQDIECFKAAQFVMGKIPEAPPTAAFR
ncbi:hypothetical protein COEREDRAFT_80517 [Coemansia reversa NRRL 1564]|uniref:C3H1-type domain-containing protein n=1 Tax=Coemansia reversa (strain ATCC 12441 / NRRL 1564) TaxID=763665 RepID=A0A2G5BET1_COERN|nr:hypothetical protein COEREDRAFT_80517 [Coemansia reversa NRRL 1564]|eukprot:PIA17519.1 hypothetical protein COEREDRAFT_80517 [Coemansia reversa NRRL 1564]